MKKFVLWQLVSLVVLLVPRGQAAEHCMHLTNFCDTIELKPSGDLQYGAWDWLCTGDWQSASIIGQTKVPRELTTRPATGWESETITLQFSLKPGLLFDLTGTDGLQDGLFTFQTNQPYTITTGHCTRGDIDNSKPRLTSTFPARRQMTPPGPALHCMRFANFCDTIVFAVSGNLAYGNWDWQCQNDWSLTSILGNAKAGQELATRPAIQYDYLFAYTTQFSFKAGRLFDLYETAGIHSGVLTARSNEPFSITNGACSQRDIDLTKPRLLDR